MAQFMELALQHNTEASVELLCVHTLNVGASSVEFLQKLLRSFPKDGIRININRWVTE